jgi:hypothetical protein
MRLCKDCRWARPHPSTDRIDEGAICARPPKFEDQPSPVTGERLPVWRWCSAERQTRVSMSLCGPEGAYWELRP